MTISSVCDRSSIRKASARDRHHVACCMARTPAPRFATRHMIRGAGPDRYSKAQQLI
jgi:hypothetical protein